MHCSYEEDSNITISVFFFFFPRSPPIPSVFIFLFLQIVGTSHFNCSFSDRPLRYHSYEVYIINIVVCIAGLKHNDRWVCIPLQGMVSL